MYVGSLALLLAAFCVFYALRHSIDRRLILVWTATALTAAVFALGTDIWIANQPLSEHDPLWLPTYYLARLPFLRSMRVWSRFGIVTIFFVAMLAGYGIKFVVDATPNRLLKRAVPPVLMLILLIDLLPGSLPHAVLEARAIDRWLAQQEGDFAVAFLPVDKVWINDMAIFGSLFHGKQLPAYIHPSHQPRAYKDFAAVAIEFPSRQSIEYLKWRGLKYLILDTEEYNGWRAPEWSVIEEQLRAFPQLRRVAEIDHFVVLALDWLLELLQAQLVRYSGLAAPFRYFFRCLPLCLARRHTHVARIRSRPPAASQSRNPGRDPAPGWQPRWPRARNCGASTRRRGPTNQCLQLCHHGDGNDAGSVGQLRRATHAAPAISRLRGSCSEHPA